MILQRVVIKGFQYQAQLKISCVLLQLEFPYGRRRVVQALWLCEETEDTVPQGIEPEMSDY